jgi:hypothetical protein
MIYSPYSRVVELMVEHGADLARTAYDYSGSVFYCFSGADALHFGLKNPRSFSTRKTHQNRFSRFLTLNPALPGIPIGSIKALLKAGMSVSKTSRCYNTEFQVTRLGLACWFMRDTRPDILELLIEHGAKPSEPIAASTHLSYVFFFFFVLTVEFRGFLVGSPESFLTLNGGNYPKLEPYSIVHNDTPLHYLYRAMWGLQPAQAVVDLLIKHGAKLNAKNHHGVSVEEVAKASASATKPETEPEYDYDEQQSDADSEDHY